MSATTAPAAAPQMRSVALDVLRIAAILGVVAIHVFGYLVVEDDARGTADWWIASVIHVASRWVVPGFVMVSGALLLSPSAHRDGPAAFYRKRLLRLGPAFVVWPLFYLIVVRIVLRDEWHGGAWAAGLLVSGTSYTAMYFLWLIAGLYLAAPVLRAYLAEGGPRRAYLFAAVVLALTVAAHAIANVLTAYGFPLELSMTGFTQWISYVGYFLAGWALRDLVLSRKWIALIAAGALVLVAETIWQVTTVPAESVVQAALPVGYLGAVVAVIALAVFVITSSVLRGVTADGRAGRVLRSISAATFGVFLVHLFFIELVRLLLPGVFDALARNAGVAAVVWLCVVIASFAVSWLARKIPGVRLLF